MMQIEKKPRSIILNENTKVTISLLIVLIGGVAWLSNLAAQTLQNKENILEIKNFMHYKFQRLEDKIDMIIDRLPPKQ